MGNKSDVSDSERQVSKSEGEALAKRYGVQFMESSAKDNLNISEIFNILGNQICKNLVESDSKQPTNNIKITDPKGGSNGNQKGCDC